MKTLQVLQFIALFMIVLSLLLTAFNIESLGGEIGKADQVLKAIILFSGAVFFILSVIMAEVSGFTSFKGIRYHKRSTGYGIVCAVSTLAAILLLGFGVLCLFT